MPNPVKWSIMSNMRKIIIRILAGLALVLFVAGAVILLRDAEHDEVIQRLESTEVVSSEAVDTEPSLEFSESTEPESTGESESETVSDVASEEEPESQERIAVATERIENPYLDYFAKNSDMVAWLLIPDTKIDEPVMWTPRDENYYLNRNFQKKSDKNGCLILDTDSCLDPVTTNQIIHGHNMKSGKMFGTLMKYEQPEYALEHPFIYLYEKELCRKYEVMAVFRSRVYKKTDRVFKFYKFFQADTPEEFEDFTSNVLALSLYETGVQPEFGDRFITLSTCAYHVANGRFVVVARECENILYLEPEN